MLRNCIRKKGKMKNRVSVSSPYYLRLAFYGV
jgi:hypothetical protein